MYTYSESYELRKFLSSIREKASDNFDILTQKVFSSTTLEQICSVEKQFDIEFHIIKACDELIQAIMEATMK